jgi:hypothetical protein
MCSRLLMGLASSTRINADANGSDSDDEPLNS